MDGLTDQSLRLNILLTLSLRFSCGYNRSAALDANSAVWMFRDWGGPARLVSPFLNCSSPETTPIQVECSHWFCAVLTGSGDVYAWWPDSGIFEKLYWGPCKPTTVLVPDDKAVIPCRIREFKANPIKLPTLPDLPDLPATGLSGEERRKETRLIKIAACDACLIGLTNKGHVLRLDGMINEDSTRIWHYVSKNVYPGALFLNHGTQLPYYSEMGDIKATRAFHPTMGDDGQEMLPQVELSSNTLLITHVSNTARFTEGPRSKTLLTFRFLLMARTSSPTHPLWCSRGKTTTAHCPTQLSSQGSRTSSSSPSLPATTTLVLSPPLENS